MQWYDSIAVGDEENGCSGIFAHSQIIYSPVFFVLMIFKFCLPIWSLLAVLEPLPTGISYAEILATSHSGVRSKFWLFPTYSTFKSFMILQSLSGACVGHSSVGSPYRVLRSYVFDDNADVLGRRYDGGSSSNSSSLPFRRHSTHLDNSEFSTRHIFIDGNRSHQQILPAIYVPGHGHILPSAPRPSVHEWTNPREYWLSRQRVNSSGQLLPIRNPSLSMINEEQINNSSMSSASTHNISADNPHHTSTSIDNKQQQQQKEPLLIDIHCSISSPPSSSTMDNSWISLSVRVFFSLFFFLPF